MVSRRRQKALRKVQFIRSFPAPEPLSPEPAAPAPDSRQCWRCGGGCRKDKHPYGWVCAFCADELDRYYMILMGLRGGTVVNLFREDVAAGTVPKVTIMRSSRAPKAQA